MEISVGIEGCSGYCSQQMVEVFIGLKLFYVDTLAYGCTQTP